MKLESFFEPIKPIITPNQEAEKQIKKIIHTLEEMECFGQQSLYIVDYRSQNFLYVSPHPLFLCGYPRDRVKELGYHFYQKVVPVEDLLMLDEINKMGFGYFYNCSLEKKTSEFLSYDFRIQHQKGYTTLINHKIKPLILADDENIWLSLCIVTLSNKKEPGNIYIQKYDGSVRYNYSLTEKILIPQKPKKITAKEHQMLTLAAQGFKEAEIAQTMSLSIEKIKNLKQKIYKLFDADNITEAVYLAQVQGLI